MAIVKSSIKKAPNLVTFSEMPMGSIGEIVTGGYDGGGLIMKVVNVGSGVVVRLDGSGMWPYFSSNTLQVRLLGKDEVVELTNE